MNIKNLVLTFLEAGDSGGNFNIQDRQLIFLWVSSTEHATFKTTCTIILNVGIHSYSKILHEHEHEQGPL